MKLFCLLLFSVLLTSHAGVSRVGADETRPVLYVQVFESSQTKMYFEQVRFAITGIKAFYNFEIRQLPKVPLPESAYYRPRRRYRAEKLLDYLEQRMPKDGTRIIGITSHDISTTKGKHTDWGILGLGRIHGKSCVVSTHRTKVRKGPKEQRLLKARYRFAKTAVHELGHTLGLYHCPQQGCLMEDAAGTVKTTDREYVLCDQCRRQVEQRHPGLLNRAPAPPWPRPKTAKPERSRLVH